MINAIILWAIAFVIYTPFGIMAERTRTGPVTFEAGNSMLGASGSIDPISGVGLLWMGLGFILMLIPAMGGAMCIIMRLSEIDPHKYDPTEIDQDD